MKYLVMRAALGKVKGAWRTLRTEGFKAVFIKFLNLLLRRRIRRPIADYSFVSNAPHGKPLGSAPIDERLATWVIPKFGIGAGGHTTIFRFISYMEQSDYRCQIVILGGRSDGSREYYRNLICDSFFPLKAKVYFDGDVVPPSGLCFATSWETAYWVRRFQSTLFKLYFVQDFEPWFYPVGTDYCLAENTYRFGFHVITAGHWLAEKLRDEYGTSAYAFSFSCDRNVYYPRPRATNPTGRIFFYARPTTERRAFEIGMLALNQLCSRIPGLMIVFAGGDLSRYEIPFPHISEGVVDVSRLAEIFNECDLALVLSLTNISLLPLELMACGTPVVTNKGPWVDWLLNDENSFRADLNILSLADAMELAISSRSEYNKIKNAGLRFVEETSWGREGEKFIAAVDALRNAHGS